MPLTNGGVEDNGKQKNMKKKFFMLVLAVMAFGMANARHTVRILAVGNSFSEDAIEQNLHEIASAAGVTMVVGNLYIPGCSLQRHVECSQTGAPDYRYRKTKADGTQTEAAHCRLDSALADEQWDYISIQQASHFSGDYSTYQPYMEQLVNHIRAHAKGKPRIVFHQTWAYASDSKHDGFRRYGNSQQQMYEAIVASTRQAIADLRPDKLVPAGTAIQNARTSSLGDHLNRDGYHLNLVYGRYTAACTWFEAITKKNVIGNSFTPQGITPLQKRIAQKAAHAAVKHPFEVTPIKD